MRRIDGARMVFAKYPESIWLLLLLLKQGSGKLNDKCVMQII